MIASFFHQGSGLGNQLHRYVATRVLAEEKGYAWGMVNPEGFKGSSFMEIDTGRELTSPYHIESPSGKVVVDSEHCLWEEWDKYCYDPDFNFVEDNTIIDGSFEDERYFGHRLEKVNEWLKVEWVDVPDEVCLIGFRGGEYYTVPELGLPKEYFDRAVNMMKAINPNMKFQVHTDDTALAMRFFPDYEIIQDIGVNWRSMRYAKYAIIANSSFYILPRMLIGGFTIAPRYWNRHNIKRWDYPQGYYSKFYYI